MADSVVMHTVRESVVRRARVRAAHDLVMSSADRWAWVRRRPTDAQDRRAWVVDSGPGYRHSKRRILCDKIIVRCAWLTGI
jgi:hypothetical protein